jgi:hypothetical protein
VELHTDNFSVQEVDLKKREREANREVANFGGMADGRG